VDQFARFLHQRVAGVVVGQAEKVAALFNDFGQLLGFRQVKGGRFVGKHMEAVLERHLGGREVHMVGRHDGDKVHALIGRERFFLLEHLLKGAVAAVWRQVEVRARIARALRLTAECSADQLDLPIDVGCDPVNGSDKGATPTTDHAHANFSTHEMMTELRFFGENADGDFRAKPAHARAGNNLGRR
jgi:hypothetical protein